MYLLLLKLEIIISTLICSTESGGVEQVVADQCNFINVINYKSIENKICKLEDTQANYTKGNGTHLTHQLKNVSEQTNINTKHSSPMNTLCQGNIFLPAEIGRRLKCRYLNGGNFFLKIAPFKEEEVFLEPRIVLFHDVVYDHEIETIKRIGIPKLKTATFRDTKTGMEQVLNIRITDVSWIEDKEDKDIKMISRRVELMTGLTTDTAEHLQFARYGIGGHYEPHYDFAPKSSPNFFGSLGTGNRIATVLFYLNDVEKGGSTVFPKLNVRLTPKKGSAAFWYNLKPNGDEDDLTLHAACPVLAGMKLAANKWLHEKGQEFRRPCHRSVLAHIPKFI